MILRRADHGSGFGTSVLQCGIIMASTSAMGARRARIIKVAAVDYRVTIES
jgi:hypothetical protein